MNGPNQGRSGASSQTGPQGQRQGQTNTRDDTYDLVSVLYHALQGAETTQMYVQDAREIGDEQLVGFFQNVCQSYDRLAEEAKQQLQHRLTTGKGGGGSNRPVH